MLCVYTSGADNGTGTAYPSGAPEFNPFPTPGFYWGSCYSIFCFLCSVLDPSLSLCPFTFDHCIVFPASIYGFWLPVWYLQTVPKLIESFCEEQANRRRISGHKEMLFIEERWFCPINRWLNDTQLFMIQLNKCVSFNHMLFSSVYFKRSWSYREY